MAINHFPNKEAAETHLKSKGFTLQADSKWKWVSKDGLIDAWVINDPHRGVYIQFFA